MKPLIIAMLLLVALPCFAQQKQHVFYFKKDGRSVDSKDSADFTRVVEEPDSGSTLFKVSEYYHDGKLKLSATSSNLNPPYYEGTSTNYFENGNKKTINHYTKNILTGEQFGFYPNGENYYTTKYPDSVAKGQVYNTGFWIISEYDSLGKPIVVNGNGHTKEYDDDFKKETGEGEVKKGKPVGVWKGYDEYFKVSYVENYDNGKLISGVSIGPNGDSVQYTGDRIVQPQYKGGLTAFYGYLSKHVKYPKYELEHNIQGKVILTFVVEKDGSISDIKVTQSASENIDNEAIRVLKASPNWIPGTAYGRKSRIYFSIPINFALTNY